MRFWHKIALQKLLQNWAQELELSQKLAQNPSYNEDSS